MDKLGTAIRIAAEVHEGQFDKAGAPYILHALAVMRLVKDHGEDAMLVAVLHDTFEDFEGPPKNKQRMMLEVEHVCGSKVYDAVMVLTHPRGQPYDDYIERVATNYLSRIVKIADLTHNMDPRRIPSDQIVDKDFVRWDKYRHALIRLERD